MPEEGPMLTKNISAKIKAAGVEDGLEEGQFKAYISVFGNVDSYGDVVVKGAFADSLKEWADSGLELPLLFGHNMYDPDFNIGHVVSAEEDDHGLLGLMQLDLEGPKAPQVYRLLKGRRINQMSFAYDILEAASVTRDGESVYELRKLGIHEASVVPLGANSETEVLAVKAATDALLSGSKAGRVLSAKNEGEVRAAHAALSKVLAHLDEENDDKKAIGTEPAKSEEPPSGANDEEPTPTPPVSGLSAATALELDLELTAV